MLLRKSRSTNSTPGYISDDAGGINPLEVPLSTHTRGEQPFNLTGVVYDSNGSLVSTQIDWKIKLDFNSSEGNNSRVALLEDANGDREVNAVEPSKALPFSKLKKIQSLSLKY